MHEHARREEAGIAGSNVGSARSFRTKESTRMEMLELLTKKE